MKVGIALAAYKPQPVFFDEQLASIQKQTHTDWICHITFDSNESDLMRTPLIAKYRNDPRFVFIQNNERLGARANFEKAIKSVLADSSVHFLSCSDQDDIWDKRKLEKSLDVLKKCPAQSLVHTDMYLYQMIDGKWKKSQFTAWQIEKRGIHNVSPFDFLVRNIVAGTAMVLDAHLARQYQNIPQEFPFHDHWMAFVASCHGGVYSISEPLYLYRQHGTNVLGITEYSGLLSTKDLNMSFLKKLKNKSTQMKQLIMAADQFGLLEKAQLVELKHNQKRRIALIKKYWSSLKNDPALARACLARLF